MDINFDYSTINTFGCVLITEDLPHLFIFDELGIVEIVPIFDDNILYTTLYPNELIVVGIDIRDVDNTVLDVFDINDDNYDELIYKITPLKFHTLKTEGLIMEDLLDIGMLDDLVNKLIDKYIENLYVNLD